MLSENAQVILEGEPSVRRLFLDWNLFHVERRYADVLSSFRRAHSQRNAWLRNGGRGPPVWDEEYVCLAEKVADARAHLVEWLQAELTNVFAQTPILPRFRVTFKRGWPQGKALSDVLSSTLQIDQEKGFTTYGPSRADFAIQTDGVDGIGSRGQGKMTVALLQYAAQLLCEKRSQGACIWLLDDLAAELDTPSFECLWGLYRSTGQQVFATALTLPERSELLCPADTSQVFHVERGVLLN
jgi:DNA replication and repair protein RecF